MNKLEKQIQDFWENQTTPEQRQEILRQLEGAGIEWAAFLQQYYQNVLSGKETSGLRAEQKSRVWQRLQEEHFEAPVRRISRRAWLPWMAAACILLVIGYYLFPQPKKHTSAPVIAAAPITTIERKNTGIKEEFLVLPDHSVVLLSPGSAIRYPQSFEVHARNIALTGRATFEAAKDSGRPFTVIANGFATTALGTKFIIDATMPVISIHLLNGKVMVNTTADAGMRMQRVYLVPGQELRINTTTKQFERMFSDSNKVRSNIKGRLSDNSLLLSFERTSLPAVFERLSKHYKTSILFDKAEVQGLSFTGSFEQSDELDLALKVVCNINQLTYVRENDHIVIRKQQ